MLSKWLSRVLKQCSNLSTTSPRCYHLSTRTREEDGDLGFEVFQKGSAPVATVPSVTIQKRGLMSLNRAAHRLLDSAEAVELLWDSERRVIGIRPAPIESPNAYPARPQSAVSDKGPILIAGSLFTRFIGLDTSQAQRWVPSVEDGILCIDLNAPAQRVTSNRSRGRSEPPTTDSSHTG